MRKTGTVPSVAAINAVNQVRKRAGLSDLPSVTTNTKDAFLNAILIERGHEFFYEGNRKIDLIRFNKYAQEMYKAKGKCRRISTCRLLTMQSNRPFLMEKS